MVDARPCFQLDGTPIVRSAWCDRIGHCWHVSYAQHTVDCHRDDTCCFCGAHRCVVLMSRGFRPDESGTMKGGHGKFRSVEAMVD